MQIADFFSSLDPEISITKGYKALCENVGIRELSQVSFLKLAGKNVLNFLHRVTTNHVENLAPYTISKTIFANEKGRIVDVVSLLNFQHHQFLIANQLYIDRLREWMGKFLLLEDIELTILPDQYFVWEILGPKADSWILQNFDNAKELLEGHFLVLSQGNVDFFLARHCGRWWLLGNQREVCLQTLGTKWHSMTFVLEEAYEIYRVERGLGKVPNEIHEKVNPHEAGLIDLVNFTKGCYIGQEVIARLDSYDKVQRHLHGVIFSSEIELEPKLTLINKDKKKVGEVTSIVHSPKLQKYIGLAYIHKKFVSESLFQISQRDISAQVVALPFT